MARTTFTVLLITTLVVFVVSSALPSFRHPAQIALHNAVRRDNTIGISEPHRSGKHNGRPRSALGLKYVEITAGRSARGFPENATIPLAR
jgi:hypothetical protein